MHFVDKSDASRKMSFWGAYKFRTKNGCILQTKVMQVEKRHFGELTNLGQKMDAFCRQK